MPNCFFSGLCGILERKEPDDNDVKAQCCHVLPSAVEVHDPELSHALLRLFLGKSDGEEVIDLLLGRLLDDVTGVEEKKGVAKEVCEVIISTAGDLLKVVAQIRELS